MNDTHTQIIPRPTQTLSNGYTVIDYRQTFEYANGEIEGIVLAMAIRGERVEYATWRVNADQGRYITTNGDYCDTLAAGVASFAKRIAA